MPPFDMRIQLWSYNFDPEPAGIGIVAGTLARGLRASGHEVEVVAAHPHYPEPRWGSRLAPYREQRAGISVTRLPLWIGRATAWERYRQELTFTAALSAAIPFLDRPDVLISASPSFPALLPAIATTRLRHIPWVLWLHDLLPEGALATGIVPKDSTVVTASPATRAGGLSRGNSYCGALPCVQREPGRQGCAFIEDRLGL